MAKLNVRKLGQSFALWTMAKLEQHALDIFQLAALLFMVAVLYR